MFRAEYGFDAPGIMKAFLGIGVGALVAGLAVVALLGGWCRFAGGALVVVSLVPLLLGLCMFFYGVYGKFRMRDFMLARIDWTGDEKVLDIGTGRGLLLIGAAKKLRDAGRAVGIDIWRQEDLSDNSLNALTAKVAAEGVAAKTVLTTEDARKLSFADASFDVVLSLYCIHNIEDQAGQKAACFEIARVLKLGGRVLVADFSPTHVYAAAFREAGLDVAYSRSFFGVALAPMWMVEAGKQ